MKFENGIWSETLAVVLRVKYTAGIVFSICIVLAVLDSFFDSRSGMNVVTLFAYSMFAISIHATIINGRFDERDFSKTRTIAGYAGRLFAMILVSFILAAIVVWTVLDVSRDLAVGLTVVLGFIIYPLALSMYGTCLPAKAVGGDASWSSAFRRGRSTFGYAAVRLVLVNGALLIALLATGVGLIAILISAGIIEKNTSPLWLTAVVTVVGILISMLMTAMASTVLSRAYLLAENPGSSAPRLRSDGIMFGNRRHPI